MFRKTSNCLTHYFTCTIFLLQIMRSTFCAFERPNVHFTMACITEYRAETFYMIFHTINQTNRLSLNKCKCSINNISPNPRLYLRKTSTALGNVSLCSLVGCGGYQLYLWVKVWSRICDSISGASHDVYTRFDFRPNTTQVNVFQRFAQASPDTPHVRITGGIMGSEVFKFPWLLYSV